MGLFRRPQPEPTPMEIQQELLGALVAMLRDIPSERPWDRRDMIVKPLLTGVEFAIQETSGDQVGGATGILPDEQTLQVVRLMRAMCTDKGTWLSMHLCVTSDGGADARFNYMEEPGPVAGGPGMSPAEVHAHLEAYPRPAETIPDWMRARLEGQEPSMP